MDDETHTDPLHEISGRELERGFREVFATPGGKRVLYWLLEQAAIYNEAFTGEAATTNYALGRQFVGRLLIGKLDEIDPHFYPQLLLDIAAIRETDRTEAANQQQGNDDDQDA